MSEYVSITQFVNSFVNEINELEAERLADRLNEFGWVKVVRCRDCEYYDGEPDMESMGEKCWRDPSHSGRSIPTVADGFCWRGERKEGE